MAPLKNKRGITEIISYALIIIIAISISVLVFAFLNLYVPKAQPECENEARLIINEVSCTIAGQEQKLELKLQNKGRFSVNAAFVRFGKEGSEAKDPINPGAEEFAPPLAPGDFIEVTYDIPQTIEILPGGEYEVEVQPSLHQEGGLVLCSDYIISQRVSCT